ncbi:MAG TPA: hypothetical protein VFO40_21080 [Chthoniobacterales bacterium]|nr:hypothetical protein [Chthoniobacterales bacterium]
MIAEKALRSQLNVSSCAITPLSLNEVRQQFDGALIFSASGDNVDARYSADIALATAYNPIVVFTQNPDARILSQLSDYGQHHSITGRMRDRNLQEREGFLGILTLMEALGAFCRCLSLALGQDWSFLLSDVARWLTESQHWMRDKSSLIQNLASGNRIVGLAGYWSEPVLADFESKWVEGGLGDIEISDFRNFSHGRYMNSFQHKEETRFVLFSTPSDLRAARFTEQILSPHFQLMRLNSSLEGIFGTCELLIWMLQFYGAIVDCRHVNVTAPTVPDEGRRLFAGATVYEHLDLPLLAEHVEEIVKRKRMAAEKAGFSPDTVEAKVPKCVVRAAYGLAIADRYDAIGLDFDGTLVPLQSGDDVPSIEICRELERLSHSLSIGIFTGRGKSVFRGLREGVSESAWRNITCFLYNGALEWKLDQGSATVLARIKDIEDVIVAIGNLPKELSNWFSSIDRSSFDCQITIHLIPGAQIDVQARVVELLTHEFSMLPLSVASSGRSIDVFPAGVSKQRAVSKWKFETTNPSHCRVLCIGDRGDRIGNDFDFLSNSSGFSVDKIDWSPYGCFPAQILVNSQNTGPNLAGALLNKLQVDDDHRIILSPFFH